MFISTFYVLCTVKAKEQEAWFENSVFPFKFEKFERRMNSNYEQTKPNLDSSAKRLTWFDCNWMVRSIQAKCMECKIVLIVISFKPLSLSAKTWKSAIISSASTIISLYTLVFQKNLFYKNMLRLRKGEELLLFWILHRIMEVVGSIACFLAMFLSATSSSNCVHTGHRALELHRDEELDPFSCAHTGHRASELYRDEELDPSNCAHTGHRASELYRDEELDPSNCVHTGHSV